MGASTNWTANDEESGKRRLGIMLQKQIRKQRHVQIPRCSTEAFATGDAALPYSFTSFFPEEEEKIKNCA